MEIIENIAAQLNLDPNIILFSFFIALGAVTCILALVVCKVIIGIRKRVRSANENPYQQQQEQELREQSNASIRNRILAMRGATEETVSVDTENVESENSTPEQEVPSPEPSTADTLSDPEPEVPVQAPVVEQPVVHQEQPLNTSAAPVASPKETLATQAPPKKEKSKSTPAAPKPHPHKAEELDDRQLHDVVSSLSEQREVKELQRKHKNAQADARNAKKRKNKSAKELKQRAKKKLTIPKTVQDTIPYKRVFPKTGIIEIEDGVFSKSYLLEDVNYQVAKQEEQVEMFLKYAEFMNAFDPATKFQITINQKNMNIAEFEEATMLKMQNDSLDELREERNDMLRSKIREGKNELVKEKYLTVSTTAPSYEAAQIVFSRLDAEIKENIKRIGGAGCIEISSADRLEILYDIYNADSVGMFGNNAVLDKDGMLVFDKEKFSFDIMRRMGLTTKDMIGPTSFTIKSDHGMIGERYFRALFMRTVPQSISDNFLKELTDMETNMLTSLIYQPIDTASALKMARQDIVNVNANVIDRQKKASKAGYSWDAINPDLKDAQEEAAALRDDLTKKDQKLFYLTLVVVLFADTKEQLDSDTKSIQAIGRRVSVEIKPLSWQQQNGLNSALPLCNNQLQIKRSLTTESCAVFMPFVNQELNDRNGGMYYGNNAVSNNLIMLNRRNCKNGNGFIFGTPGSGKSMSAKQEMLTVLLSSDDDVIVIDPEGEYEPMAEMLGDVAEVIRIEPGSDVHINPFDIDLNCDSDDNPITIKSDFIGSLCENIVGDRFGLTPGQRSLIDRCVKFAYKPYMDSRNPISGAYDKSLLPTLKTFYDILRDQPGYDALQLADALEIYVTGSQNLFAYPTNVEYSKRFVVYDIKKIGSSMKSLGLLVVLDNIWNRIVSGRQKGKNTWFFIDEIYLLFKVESSAEFLRNLYKRARKYGGIPTGITQNVTDLLENPTARTMISNCEYIQMLNQAPLDRAQLGDLLNISQTQMSYITNASPGHGLIYDGSHIVPFVNILPKGTKQYQAMTTKLSEVKERDEQKKEHAEAAGEEVYVHSPEAELDSDYVYEPNLTS